MHIWGDEWFEKHGEDFYTASEYIHKMLMIYGRISIMNFKEKYGTLRTQGYYEWDGTLHMLLYPGYSYIQCGRILSFLDTRLFANLMKFSGLLYILRYLQRKWINYVFQKILKKYPQLILELVADTDVYPHIRPGFFGPVDGELIHRLVWAFEG